MVRFTQVIQFIFCLVSMILTSLFALSLSGMSVGEIGDSDGFIEKVLSACLFVLIGCCIDFGKYLFWSQRDRSHYYGMIGLILTGFSLLASCAFFISAEFSAANKSRLVTTEYIAMQQRVHGLREEINHHERLLESRLNSKYHQQWVEGEKNSVRIGELQNSLAELIESSSEIGKKSAMEQVPITSFFAVLSQILNVSTDVIRNIGYGMLALLLEVSTLGAISLARTVQVENAEANDDHKNSYFESEIPDEDSELREKITKLSNDIIQGRINPVTRKIKVAQYGLNMNEIKQVLLNLYLAGLIDKDARKSYKLSSNI